ncbi:MAG: hypothetical protein ACOYMN_17515 [Roseimicrobium sp.]
MSFVVFVLFGQVSLGDFSGLQNALAEMELVPALSCGLLGVLMVATVSRWVARGSRLSTASRMDAVFDNMFRGSAHALALYQEGKGVEGSPCSTIYQNACRELAYQLLGTDDVDKSFALRLRGAGRITPAQYGGVQRAIRRSVADASRWFRGGLAGGNAVTLLQLGGCGALLGILDHVGEGTLNLDTAAASLWPAALALFFSAVSNAWRLRLVQRADDVAAKLDDFALELAAMFDRVYVDHRQPMETLPSLDGMGMVEGPSFNQAPAVFASRTA